MNNILFISHNLRLEGSVKMLFMVLEFVHQSDYCIEVLSYAGGPYENLLKKKNIKYKIIEEDTEQFYLSNKDYLIGFDCIIANTCLSYEIINLYNNTLPIIWYLHEADSLIDTSNDINKLPQLLENKDNIVVVSNYSKHVLKSKFNAHDVSVISNYISNGFPIKKKNYKLFEKETINFSYIGSIDFNKGIDILLEANSRCKNRSKFKINIAGNILDKKYKEDILDFYQEVNINYLGVVDKEEKVSLFNDTDVFIVPSRGESFSLVVQEAHECGIPVIAPKCDWSKDFVDESSDWVFEDIDNLAHILDNIVDNKYDIDSKSSNALNKYKSFMSYEKFKNSWFKKINSAKDYVNINNFYLCSGCGACVNSCPNNAIVMKENNERFLYPYVNLKKCTHCNKCIEVCPVLHTKYNNSDKPKCYAIAADDKTRMIGSTSGAMFGLLSNYFLENSWYVCGAMYDDKFVLRHKVSNKPSDIEQMKGSKYVQSNTDDSYKIIRKLLDENNKVLFTGTPCQVAGLNSFLKKSYNNLVCMDIVCNGVPSPGIFNKYLLDNFNIDKIKDIKFRDKNSNGWHDSHFIVKNNKNNIDQKLLDNEYVSLFLNGVINRKSCINCPFQYIPRQGDLSCGDFWGIEDIDPDIDDNKGISVVLANNEKGNNLINRIKNNFKIFKEKSLTDATKKNPNIIGSPVPHTDRDKFFDYYNEQANLKDLNNAIVHKKCDVILSNFWYAKNYGAILTCYGVYKTLVNMGYSVKLINYIPNNWLPFYWGSFAQDFALRKMELTDCCNTFDDFIKLNDISDNFVVGSDQVFRYKIYKENSGNLVHFDFTDPNKRRIAISASFGEDSYEASKYEKKKLQYLLDSFTAISVREDSGQKILKNDFGLDSDLVCDPVFALDRKEWIDLAGKEPRLVRNYFATYVLAGGHSDEKIDWIEQCISAIEKTSDLSSFKMLFQKNYSVENWLNYLKFSKFIVTDSFHASCFSIIFNKPLIYILENSSLYTRLDNIFKHYNVEACIIDRNSYLEYVEHPYIPKPKFNMYKKQTKVDSEIFNKWLQSSFNKKIPKIKDFDDFQYLQEIEKYKLEANKLLDEKNHITNDLNNLQQHIDTLSDMYSAVMASTSWKVSKPLRLISKTLKKIFKK